MGSRARRWLIPLDCSRLEGSVVASRRTAEPKAVQNTRLSISRESLFTLHDVISFSARAKPVSQRLACMYGAGQIVGSDFVK